MTTRVIDWRRRPLMGACAALALAGVMCAPPRAGAAGAPAHDGGTHRHKGAAATRGSASARGTVSVDGVTVVSVSGGQTCPTYVQDVLAGDLASLRAAVDGVPALDAGQKSAVQRELTTLARDVQALAAGPGPLQSSTSGVTVSASIRGSGVLITLSALAPGHLYQASRPVDSFILTLQASRC